jgi:organic radical activating enzyme
MTSRPAAAPSRGTIAFLLNYRCTIRCAHCNVEAAPGRKKKMALGNVFGWIDDTAAYGNGAIRNIELTGGEPFYDLQTLALVSDHAMNAGLEVSVCTNAGWAGTLERAIITLNELPAIRHLTIGTSVHHQQFIPDGHIHNAVIASALLGRRYDITVTTESEKDEPYRSLMERLHRIASPRQIRTTITFPAGRAAKHPAPGLVQKKSPVPSTAPCPSSDSCVILPDGRVMLCNGPMMTRRGSCPLCLGNLRRESFQTVLDRAAGNPLFHLIREWGPHRLVALLVTSGHGDRLPKEYIQGSSCDVCSKILSDRRLARLIAEILDVPRNGRTMSFSKAQHQELLFRPSENQPEGDARRDAAISPLTA